MQVQYYSIHFLYVISLHFSYEMKEVQIMYMLNSYFHNHSFNKNSWGDIVANCFPEEPTRRTNLK